MVVAPIQEPGERDRVVTLQQLAESTGTGSNFPIEGWSTLVATMPASKADLSGRERMIAGELSAKVDSMFVINYRSDMDPDLVDVPKTRRVVLAGRVFDIVAAFHIGRKDGVQLMTLAGSRL